MLKYLVQNATGAPRIRMMGKESFAVQPLRTPTVESCALGRKLLVGRAAELAANAGGDPRPSPATGRIAASIPTASVRLVNLSGANLYFKIQSKAGSADFCCQPESGMLRSQSAVIVAVACVSERNPEGAVFRCMWGETQPCTRSSNKFHLHFHPTLMSSSPTDDLSKESDNSKNSEVDAKSSAARQDSGDSVVRSRQAGWPPWERSDYTGSEPSAEDVDAERSAAYKFIAAAEAGETRHTNAASQHTSSKDQRKGHGFFCCGMIGSLACQGALVMFMVWVITFSFPERTGGLSGVFTPGSLVLPSFFAGMATQWLRTLLFRGRANAQSNAPSLAKSKSD